MNKITEEKISILGCGWLGIPLAAHLVRDGYRVKGSTTTAQKLPKLKEMGIEPYLVDLDVLTEEVMPFLEASILIIMVTSKSTFAFERLISHIKKSSLKKILFVSSTSVYGPSEGIINEMTEVLPTPLVEIEELLFSASHIETTIIRFGGLFGYDRKPGRFFRSGRKVKDPDNVVNLIHRDDCIAIIDRVIKQRVWGEIFNGTSDAHPTKREFYTKAALDIGVEPPEFEPTSSAVMKKVSNEKIKTMLGYAFKYPDVMSIKFE